MQSKTIIGAGALLLFAIYAFTLVFDRNSTNQRVMSAKLDAQNSQFDADFKKAWDGDKVDKKELAKLQDRADKAQAKADELEAKATADAEAEDAKVKKLRDQSFKQLQAQSQEIGE